MFHKIALLLVIIGAVNVGLVTLAGVNFIGLFGALSHVINVLVGVSGIYLLLATYTTILKKA
jgi:uncharacterized membrane protein YuzA (DUF378 family)